MMSQKTIVKQNIMLYLKPILCCIILCLTLSGDQIPRYKNKYQNNQQKVTYEWDTHWTLHKIIGFNPITASGYQYGDSIAVFWKANIKWRCKNCNSTGGYQIFKKTVYSEDITVTENAYVWSAPYLMNSPVIEYTGEAILVLLGIPTSFIDLVINYINRYFVEHVNSSNITVPINSLKPIDNQIPKYHYCD